MAIFHVSVKIGGRSKGQNAVRSASYRHAAKMYCERVDEAYDYTRKTGVENLGIHVGEGAPQWAQDLSELSRINPEIASEKLWNMIERIEKHERAQLFREVEIALPMEFSRAQNRALAQRVIEELSSMGAMVDASIHWDFDEVRLEPRPHLHAMMPMRPMTEEGFGGKRRYLYGPDHPFAKTPANVRVMADPTGFKDFVPKIREIYEREANLAYAQAGLDIRIDRRSLDAQKVGLEPVNGGYLADRSMDNPHQAELRAMDEARRLKNADRIRANPELVLDALTRTRSTFYAHDVARLVGRYFDPAEASEISRLVETVMNSGQVVRVSDDRGLPGLERYTTQQLLAQEANIVVGGGKLARMNTHQVEETIFERAVRIAEDQIRLRHPGFEALAPSQLEAARYLAQGSDLGVVRGLAGTGKSTLLSVAREAWEGAGLRVIGATPSGIAAEGMGREAGINSFTISGLAQAWKSGRERLDEKTVLVIDEAGMVGTADLEGILQRVLEAKAKLVLVGDHRQLQPIAAGTPFELLMKRGDGVVLDDIQRQRSAIHKVATRALAEGNISKALSIYEGEGRVREVVSLKEAYGAIAKSFIEREKAGHAPELSQLALAYTRADAANINAAIRDVRVAEGYVTDQRLVRLVPDPLSAERSSPIERMLGIGDWVVFRENNQSLGVKNGTRGIVTEIDGEGTTAVVTVSIPGNGKPIRVDLSEYNRLDYAYALTVHRAQGVSVETSYVLATRHYDAMSIYVAMSRHKGDLSVYLPMTEFRHEAAAEKVLGLTNAQPALWELLAAETSPKLAESLAQVQPHLSAVAQDIIERGAYETFSAIHELYEHVKHYYHQLEQHRWGGTTRELRESLIYAANIVLADPDLLARHAASDLEAKASRAITIERHIFQGPDPIAELDLDRSVPDPRLFRLAYGDVDKFFADYQRVYKDMRSAEREYRSFANQLDMQRILSEIRTRKLSPAEEESLERHGRLRETFERSRDHFLDRGEVFLRDPATREAVGRMGYGPEIKTWDRVNAFRNRTHTVAAVLAPARFIAKVMLKALERGFSIHV